MRVTSWPGMKARLLSLGGVRVTGAPVDEYISTPSAGPGAGGEGSFFFGNGDRRVRLTIRQDSPALLHHEGGGNAVITLGEKRVRGRLEEIGLHCPRQAYITVTAGCTFNCRFCAVPHLAGRRRSPEEIVAMVREVRDRIDAISLTSGIATDPAEEEEYILRVVERLKGMGLPIGVSIYPVEGTPRRLHESGVLEVKFNVETATPELFERMCPGFEREDLISALRESVGIFGKGRVYSNVLVGLGETDREMAECIDELTSMGVIPVLRPLTPAGDLAGWKRPSADRLIRLFGIHREALEREGLDGSIARTMCAACTGCDLAPWRDA
ncbi:MAG: radical SAM protein [Methanoculleaceae archaeon]